MSKIITILIDQDGVLANYNKHLIELARENFPDEPKVEEGKLTLFDTHLHFSEEHRKEIDDFSLCPGFFASLEPFDGAVEALHDLLSTGIDVRICTSPKKRSDDCAKEKLGWIRKHLGQEFVGRTILTSDKTLIRGSVLIDDKPEVVGVARPSWEHVIFDRPYNRNVIGKRRLTWQNYREILGLS